MSDDAENIFDEDLLADDSHSSPQLWGEDTTIPDAAVPVSEKKNAIPRYDNSSQQAKGFVRKTKARELALQMLFQADVNPETPEQDIADQLRDRLQQADMFQFAWDTYRGVLRERDALDAAISETATNWKLSRMAVTDRNVLRLGAYELKHVETPYGVVLDEAIDLAKKFGTNNSAAFVNGVLDKLVPESKRPAGSSRPRTTSVERAAEVEDANTTDETISSYAKPEDIPLKPGISPIKFRRKSEPEE